MSKSLYEANQEVLNHNATYDDFPVGTRVKIVTLCEDFNFFYGETGVVTKNTGKYLGINVKYDTPREYEDGHIEYEWNFKPQSLEVIERKPCKFLNKLWYDFYRGRD